MPGNYGRAALTQTMSAVTAACMVLRKDTFEAVGGFDETLAVAYNDVDLCLRLGARGFRNVWTPFAELYHFESVSRGDDLQGANRPRFLAESQAMRDRWQGLLDADPYYNPNLSLTRADLWFAYPPRHPRPWWQRRENYTDGHDAGSLQGARLPSAGDPDLRESRYSRPLHQLGPRTVVGRDSAAGAAGPVHLRVLQRHADPSERRAAVPSEFALYAFCGLLPWIAVADALTRSSSVLLEQTPLIKKVVFPSEILPVHLVLSALFVEIVGLAVFLVVVMIWRAAARLGAAHVAVRRWPCSSSS